jgi:hypothetical protein
MSGSKARGGSSEEATGQGRGNDGGSGKEALGQGMGGNDSDSDEEVAGRGRGASPVREQRRYSYVSGGVDLDLRNEWARAEGRGLL